jgi:hypothetical protein
MPKATPFPITPPPGVVLTEAGKVVAGRYSGADRMRSKNGRPQKIGGWAQQDSLATSGTPRASHAWRDNVSNQYLSAGTYRKLYVYDPSWAQNDITPFRLTGTLANPFTTTAGSSVVSVAHAVHGLNPGDQIIFPSTTVTGNTAGTVALNTVSSDLRNLVVGAAITGTDVPANTTLVLLGASADNMSNVATGSHNGITFTITPAVVGAGGNLSGAFIVQTVTSSNAYTFDCGVIAAVSTSGGGTVSYQYEIPVGVEIGTYGYGFGVSGYGLSTYGTSRAQSTIYIEPRVWSLDHFGQLLIASYNGGTIYQFDPTQVQPWPRAVVISSDAALPTDCRFVFVTPERFVFALRSGMNVSWNSQGDLTTWTPSATNTANTRTLTEGTKLVAGRPLAPYQSLVWTDSAVYLFQWTGSQFVYDSNLVARDCGLIAPYANVSVNGVAYWMGSSNFFTYDGSVRPMANVEDIRKAVFDQVDPAMAYQANAVYNPVHNDILFSFTRRGQQNPSAAVLYSIEDQCWWPQTFGRASGTHFQQGDTRPLMAGTDGHIYLHEQGFDANGIAMPYSLTLGAYPIENGADLFQVLGIEWDAFQQVGSPSLTLNCYDRLGDAAPEDTETETVLAGTLVDFHSCGRYIGFVLTDSELGCYLRMGAPAALISPKGKRR